MHTFKFILQDNWTDRFTFVTVDQCIDIDDAVDHVKKEFPSHTIDQIKFID